MVNTQRKLIGVITLRELILAPVGALISELMNHDPIFASVHTSQEEIAALIARYDLMALPIVNDDQHMIGIVTYDDAMDVVEQEATEAHLRPQLRSWGRKWLTRKLTSFATRRRN